MSEKQYFKVEYDEEWYLFDSTRISEQLVKEQAEYGYGVFANSLSPSEICDLLNELSDENRQLKEKLDFFKDLAQRTEHEKEDYADKYYNLLKKKFSDDEIRRLYSDLQRREYEKHCNGGTTFTAKLKQEVKY